MTRLRAPAPAKVNLALAITGIRDDGYHTLRSVFLRLALHDVLEVELDPGAPGDTLAIDGDLVPSHDNLVLRAAAQLRAGVDATLPALRFRLTKRIPVAAGLAGGSSDAATALDLALAAWGLRLDPAARLDVARQLGADVPFFAAGHEVSLVEGIGEQLATLPPVDPAAGLVLVTLPARLATAAVFAELDRLSPAVSSAAASSRRVDDLAGMLRGGVDGTALASATATLRDANDLWPAACRLAPGLAAARDAVAAILDRTVLLTGSGPTLFAVYPSGAAAGRAAARLQAAGAPELAGAAIISTTTARGGDT